MTLLFQPVFRFMKWRKIPVKQAFSHLETLQRLSAVSVFTLYVDRAGPENPELNFSQNASDADFDGVYQSGYVGNEYLFAITDSSAGESVGVVNQGQYDAV